MTDASRAETPTGGSNQIGTDCETAGPAMAGLMERLGTRVHFAKGAEIFGQDENVNLIHGVTAGAVRTTRMLNDGRREIGNFYYSGDVIGFETGQVHRYAAEALADSTICIVHGSLLRLPSGDGALDIAIWTATRRELERTQEHVLLLGRKSASERVASFLVSHGKTGSDGRVGLPMGRQDMADYLGLTIETVSRMFKFLRDAEIVEFTDGRHFVVRHQKKLDLLAA